MPIMTSYSLLLHESAETTRLTWTQTCEVHPALLRGKGRAQPVLLTLQLRGQRQEDPSQSLCPVTTKQRSSCRVWRPPAAEGAMEQEPVTPISPQRGRGCQMPAQELRGQQRLAGCICLLLPLEKSSCPGRSLTRLKYIPISLRLLAPSPYPKK